MVQYCSTKTPRGSETEKFVTHRSWRWYKASLKEPCGEVKAGCRQRPWQNLGICLYQSHGWKALGFSGQGQIGQHKPKRWSFVNSTGGLIYGTHKRKALGDGRGEWESAYHPGCWGSCIRNLHLLGHVLTGWASVGSRPLQAAQPHKVDGKAAVLRSSLAKLSTASHLKYRFG